MDGGKFDDFDLERFHSLIAEELGLSVDELQKSWMKDESDRVDENGQLIGHLITFREDMPFDLRARTRGMAGEYTAHIRRILLDS